MSFDVDETIAAIASARGPGARAIIRLSGPKTLNCVQQCFHADGDWSQGQVAKVTTGTIQLDETHALPCDLYLWPTRRSYTKQPAAELHLPGSIPLAETALAKLCQYGARLAHPGEFTMRAFLAGRIDLPQAEAVLGVIDATNHRALDRALRQLAGGLSSELAALRDQMLNLLADIEAGLDFVEEDIEFVSAQQTVARIGEATEVIKKLLEKMHRRATTDALPKVVLVGRPNVGKSCLFNALCPEGQSLVSELSGTTRDYVESPLRSTDTDEAFCLLVDTAGVADGEKNRLSIDPLSSQSVTTDQWQEADLVLVCVDLSDEHAETDNELLQATAGKTRLVVATKSDLGPSSDDADTSTALPPGTIHISALKGEGITALGDAIRRTIVDAQDDETQVVQSTAGRCRESLQEALACLQRASSIAEASVGDELLAAELRLALDQLGQIVGAIYTDDVLDRIFGRFCIGK